MKVFYQRAVSVRSFIRLSAGVNWMPSHPPAAQCNEGPDGFDPGRRARPLEEIRRLMPARMILQIPGRTMGSGVPRRSTPLWW